MSKTRKKPSKKSDIDLGILESYIVKKFDTESRLQECFGMFVKFPDVKYFITGGPVCSERFTSDNFTAVCIGPTQVEISQGLNLINYVGTAVATQFSGEDFHAMVAVDFLSSYLKEHLEEMDSPKSLAVEFIIFDHVGDKLMIVSFNGDYAIYDLEHGTRNIMWVGGYQNENPNLSKDLVKLVTQEMTNDQMRAITLKLKDKYKISTATIYYEKREN